MTSTTTARAPGGFRHEAVFYAGDSEFVPTIEPFVRDAVVAGDPILVVVSRQKIDALRIALGDAADAVEFADMARIGRNPARIIPAWHAFVDRHGAAPGLRGVGEPIDIDRSESELAECQRHEALLNLAFADAPPFRLQCPYDMTSLPPQVLTEARRSHPYVAAAGCSATSDEYVDRGAESAGFSEPLPEPPASAHALRFRDGDLTTVRDLVARRAAAAGLTRSKVADLVLAVNELATNSLRYGGGHGTLRVWDDTRGLACDVSDSGRFSDPLVGRERPGPGRLGGRGVWMVNQLCDLVQIRSLHGGTLVRVFAYRD